MDTENREGPETLPEGGQTFQHPTGHPLDWLKSALERPNLLSKSREGALVRDGGAGRRSGPPEVRTDSREVSGLSRSGRSGCGIRRPVKGDAHPGQRGVSVPGLMNDPWEYEEPVPFSRAMVVDLCGAALLFVSGTASVGPRGETLHPGDFEAQATRMLNNVTGLLEASCAGWRDVVKTSFYLKSMKDYSSFSRIRLGFLKGLGVFPFPASTCIEAKLCREDLLCEMEAIAVVRRPLEPSSEVVP